MTKIYDMPRACGKTMYLLRRSHKTGIPVVVRNADFAKALQQDAKNMDLDKAIVITPSDMRSKRYNYVFVDDLPYVWQSLTGTRIVEATYTSEEIRTNEDNQNSRRSQEDTRNRKESTRSDNAVS